MDNPIKKAFSAVGGIDDALKAWIEKEVHRGELRAQILLLKLELELSEANHHRIEEKIAEIHSELEKEN